MSSDNEQRMIVTDDYGSVPEGTYEFLKSRNITPAEWDELTDCFKSDYAAARQFILDYTRDGAYDAWQAGQAIYRRSR